MSAATQRTVRVGTTTKSPVVIAAWLVGVLSDQLFAFGVHYEHETRWSESRDLLLGAGERLGGQEKQGEGE